MSECPGRTVVIGLGNPLMTDDGAGLAALRALSEGWTFTGDVALVDGGTWGMNLLPIVEEADRVLLLDAVHVRARPGTVVEMERAELPRFFALKLSPHQIDLKDVLALAELRGTLPEDTIAIGVEPDRIEMGTELSAVVQAALSEVVERAVRRLEGWGHLATEREPVHA